MSAAKKIELPTMMMIQQIFDVPPPIDIDKAIDREFELIKPQLKIKPGARIAVGVGSRGITNLAHTVRGVVAKLRELGAKPFVMPAMGSHGGATAEGQIDVLRHRGVTEESCGAPVNATMEVVSMGNTDDGIPIFLNRLAHEADGIVLVNRIKPHTNFIGRTESGILKMIAIGMGNQEGAEHYHRLSLVRDQYTIISSAGRELVKRCKFLFGVGLVENQDHQTCNLRILPQAKVEEMESELLVQARNLLPGLPVDQIDLLIVDEMGKDISGEGIDPNVVGRDCCSYGAKRPNPYITRIFVRDLTEATEGSALGVGQADFTLKRLVEKIDFATTAVNSLTACCPESARVPLAYETDMEALAAALMSIRPYTMDDLGIVYIKNTLELNHVMISEAYRGIVESASNLKILEDNRALTFNEKGMLITPFPFGREFEE